MGYYLTCSRCGKPVSSAIPGGTRAVTVRAWIECPKCVAAQPDVEQRIAEAVAIEKERCVLIAETKGQQYKGIERYNPLWHYGYSAAAKEIVEAIRTRGGEE